MPSARSAIAPVLLLALALAWASTGLAQNAGAVDARARAVAVGPTHTVAILSDGSVITWGANARGQLGRGTIDGPNIRREIEVLPGVENAVAVVAGEEFNLVLLADGTVMSWGANLEGQLGLGPAGVMPRAGQAMPTVTTPTRVPGLANVTAIAAGARFALALRSDGSVVAWGDGAMGALGDGKGVGSGQHYAVPFPRAVVGLSGVTAIAAGSEFGLALRDDGSVWGWGANQYGQMGDDKVDFKPAPVRIAGLSGVRALHGGSRTAFAVLTGGTVVAWGRNDCDVLGVSTRQLAKSSQPRPIAGLSGVQQLAAALTTCHAVALLGDGTARAWG